MNDSDSEYKRHFNNALSNYTGVLGIIDRFAAEIPLNPSAAIPDKWADEPLLLLGYYLRLLKLTKTEKRKLREDLRRMTESHSAQYIWENRLRLVAEIEFIRTF